METGIRGIQEWKKTNWIVDASSQEAGDNCGLPKDVALETEID